MGLLTIGRGALVTLFLLAAAPAARAQLLSPGRLSASHADLEGVRRCTSCHELGERGASDARCLDCHTLVRDRVARKTGYHATVAGQACADCHKDHFGRDFATIRLDTAAFDHDADAGWTVREAHGRLACRDCHRADLVRDAAVRDALAPRRRLDHTFLGLGTACTACHADDDPHAGQFRDRACDDCHGEADWKRPDRFDHDATRYRLTGRHSRVACRECHAPLPGRAGSLKLTGVPFAACTDCHRDPHAGRMAGRCEQCHTTGGWTRLDRPAFERRFDHSRTKFSLEGRHAEAACAACHDRSRGRTATIQLRFATAAGAYPRPVFEQCVSCHVDTHGGALRDVPGGIECRNCHGQDGWLPTSFGLARHDRDTDYPLTGAHRAVPCLACHRNPARGHRDFTFALPSRDCLQCHRTDDPHAGQFGDRACDDCHQTASFRIASFDHTRTRYPLDGEHRNVACAACHPLVTEAGREVRRYRPLGMTCRDCHGETL